MCFCPGSTLFELAIRLFIMMSKKRAEMTDDQKNIILGMFKSGMKPGKIAKELSIDRSTTYTFLKRYNESGTIKNKKRSG